MCIRDRSLSDTHDIFPSSGSSTTPTYGYIQDSTGAWHSMTWTGNTPSTNTLGGVQISGSGTINRYATVVYSQLLAGLMSTSGFPANGFMGAWGIFNYKINMMLTSAATGILSINTSSLTGTPLPSISSEYTLSVIPGFSPSGTFTFKYTDAGGTLRTSATVPYNATPTQVLNAIQGMAGLGGASLSSFAGGTSFFGGLGQSDIIGIVLPIGITAFNIDSTGLTNCTAYCYLNDFAIQNQLGAVASSLTQYNSGSSNDFTWYEGKNEPDQNSYSQYNGGLNINAIQYAQMRSALKAGNSNARLVGPDFSKNGPDNASGNVSQPNSWIIDWVRAVRGAGQDVDGISMHLYNGYNGQYKVLEGILADLRTKLSTLASPSIQDIPFWCTEAGNIRLSFIHGRFIDPRRIINWLTTLYLAGERYGMPKENICVYYDHEHGDTYYSPFAQNNDLLPHHAFYRTYSDELFGKTWYGSNVSGPAPAISALSCGSVGNNIYRVDVFNGTNGTIAVITAQGIPNDTITLNVPDTGSITYSDFQGNTNTVTVSGGQIVVPISDLPTYVRLAASSYNSISVADIGSGVKAATDLALTATASVTALSGMITTPQAQPASYAIDGNYRTDGYLSINNLPDYAFSAISNSTSINCYFQIKWTTAQTINGVIIRQLPPWTDVGPASAITKATLQASNDGSTWNNCATTAGNHWNTSGVYNNTTANSFKSPMGTDDSYISFYDYNWVHNVHLSAPITVKYLRLVVTGVTYGHFPDAASNSNHNTQNAYLRISEFVVI